MALLQPEGLIHGHYECKSLDRSLPIFTDLLACDVSGREGTSAFVQHPNTAWTIIVHEAGHFFFRFFEILGSLFVVTKYF